MKQVLAPLFFASGLSLANPLFADETPNCNVLDAMVKSAIAENSPKTWQPEGLMIPLPDPLVLKEAKRCLPRKYETAFGTFIVNFGNLDYYMQGYTWYKLKIIPKE